MKFYLFDKLYIIIKDDLNKIVIKELNKIITDAKMNFIAHIRNFIVNGKHTNKFFDKMA